jgi:hypothetical protein
MPGSPGLDGPKGEKGECGFKGFMGDRGKPGDIVISICQKNNYNNIKISIFSKKFN